MHVLPSMTDQPVLVSLVFLLGSGMAFYTAIQSCIFAYTGYRRPVYLFFAAMSVAVAILFLIDANYYAVQSIEGARPFLRWRVAVVLAFYPALFGFIAAYTRTTGYWPWLALLVCCTLGLLWLNFAMPNSLRFLSLHGPRTWNTPWGDTLLLFSGEVSAWNLVSRVLASTVLVWGLIRSLTLYVRGERRRGLMLGIAVAVMLCSSSLSLFIDVGKLDLFYVGGLAFLAVVLFMSFTLGLELHEINHALNATSEQLRQQVAVQEKTEQHIRELGFFDALTGLPSRARLDEWLASILHRNGPATKGALIMLGLDDFKTINNVLGHEVGDRILQMVGRRLSDTGVPDGLLTRFSGDKFAVLLPDLGPGAAEPETRANSAAQRYLDALSVPFEFDSHILEVGACAGISIFSYPSEDDKKPLQCAEMALFRAKTRGRGSIQLYESGMQTEAAEHLQLERDMRKGLARDEFDVFYQPQIGRDGQVLGAEALLRWRHPERGFVSPAKFIPVAEKSGLIRELGIRVLRQACQQIRQLGDTHPEFTGHISVNVSNWQLNQGDFAKDVQGVLAECGVATGRVVLEITESAFIHDLGDAIQRISGMRAIGLRFSIDDFGTGYASLSYLRQLPVDELKIDQSFIKNLGTDERDSRLVETIVSIAHHFNLQVIAEGVENELQCQLLGRMNVWALQGYHFARPMDAQQFGA